MDYPDEFNPFGDDDADNDESINKTTNSVKQEETNNSTQSSGMNPFGDDEDDETEPSNDTTQSKETPSNVRVSATKDANYDDSLNPFGDDEDDDGQTSSNITSNSGSGSFYPVPAPRRSARSNKSTPQSLHSSPVPSQRSSQSRSSLRNIVRPNVPPPPLPTTDPVTDLHTLRQISARSLDINDNHHQASVGSPQRSSTPVAPKRLGKKKAPAPPTPTSVDKCETSIKVNGDHLKDNTSCDNSTMSVDSANASMVSSFPPSPALSSRSAMSARRQSLTPSTHSEVKSDADSDASSTLREKSVVNTLTKKKRQAPAPPQAVRRTVCSSIDEIQTELNDIGDQLAELQEHVVCLEKEFQAEARSSETPMSELIMNYMEFARKTCMLARRQEELMYQ